MRFIAALILLLSLAACGGNGGGGSNGGPIGGTPMVIPLVLTSPGTASFAENGTGTVYQATTAGGSGAAVTFSLSGVDAGQFNLSSGGTLTFKTPPDFEAPADSDRDNVYQIVIAAGDGTYQAQLTILITVTNTPDQTVIAQVGGLYNQGTYVAAVPGQKSVFVATQDGKIYLVDPATRNQGSLYLSISNLGSSSSSDHGLLSIAAAPDFAASGILYAFVTDATGNLEVRRYGRSGPTTGDASSERIILRIPHSIQASDRLGGWMGFGPDNFLYLSTGDGTDGSNSQNLASLMGKLLRIDVSRDDFPGDPARNYAIPPGNPFANSAAAPEIFAYGFRDPHRGGFDGSNLLLDDQQDQPGTQQEINLIRPADAGGNYGWNYGFNGSPPPAGVIPPVIEVNFTRISFIGHVVGGYVYRGPAPQLAGQYLFYTITQPPNEGGLESIAASSLVQGTTLKAPSCCPRMVSPTDSFIIGSFGEDADHNLYMLMTSGELYEIRVQ